MVEHLDAVVLSAMVMVDIVPRPNDPAERAQAVVCSHCKAPLGEVPTDRPEPNINGQYVLNRVAIKSYMLGAAEHVAHANHTANANRGGAELNGGGDGALGGSTQEAQQFVASELDKLNTVITQIQKVVLCQQEQIDDLRQRLANPNGNFAMS